MRKLLLLLFALLSTASLIGQNLTEGFETWPPAGWTIINSANAGNNISQSNTYAHSGTYSARFSSNLSGAPYDQYMITPKLVVSAGNQTITFWYRRYTSGTESFTVGWSSTGTNIATDFTWSSTITNASTSWQQYSKTDLPIGTKYVAIHYFSNWMYYFYIDDVAGPPLGVQNPTSFAATPFSTTQINLGWSLYSGNAVMLAYNTTNSFGTPVDGTTYAVSTTLPGGNGTVLYNGTNTTFNHTLLNPSTTYYYKIWSKDGSTNYSGGAASSATTLCGSFALPFSQGFNVTTIPPCWSTQLVTATAEKISFVPSSSYETATPQEGADFVMFNSFSSTGGGAGAEERLISPQIVTTGTSSVNVEFYWWESSNASYTNIAEGVQLEWSTNGTTWTNSTFCPRYVASAPATGGWAKKTITLPAGAGNIPALYVSFKFHSEYGYNCYLDNLVVQASPPSIVYSPLMNTSSTSARTLTTTIVSPSSGIPTTGIGLPRLYWRIGSGSWTGVTANTPVVGSTYTFTFGAGVATGNVIQYYVVAQDLSATPVLIANPSAGIGALTPNPPTAASPPTTPNAYTIIPTFCGTKVIGPGGDYTTLTAAVAALNGSEISCPVVFSFNASYSSATETFPIIINANSGSSATNTLTIKPGAGVAATISGSATSLLEFFGIDYVTIDGLNTGGSSLTFNNASSSGVDLWIGSTPTDGATFNTIRNCSFLGASGTTTIAGILAGSGTTLGNSAEVPNSNNTIQYNTFKSTQNAMYINGATAFDQNWNISNNAMGSTVSTEKHGYRGILIGNAANFVISNNTIVGVLSSTTSSATTQGIQLAFAHNGGAIYGNKIGNISQVNTTGWGSAGMTLGSSSTAANVSIYNNVIYDVTGYGYNGTGSGDNGWGIYVATGGGYNLYFNSINMNTPETSSTSIVAAINIASGLAANALVLKDNIFNIPATNTVGTRYAIYSASANTAFSDINYNDYSSVGTLGYLGSAINTIAAWQTATGKDANSVSIDPVFTSATNLLPTNAALMLKGTAIAGITTDITGAGRTNPPDIGAYQFATLPAVVTTAATLNTLTGATLNGTVTAANLTVTTGFDYGLTVAYGSSVAASPATVSGNTLTTISAVITGMPQNIVVHYRAKGTNGGSTVYGADMTFTTGGAPIVTTQPATIVGATFATLNGTVDPNWDNTTVSFEYGLTVAYGTPVVVPGTYSGHTVQTFSANISGLTINQTYHFRAKAVNGGGTVYGVDQTFFTTCVIPPVPGAITGPGGVCKTGTGYTYSVPQVPYGFVYNWTFPTGFTVTSYPHSNVVTVDVSNLAVAGNVTVVAASDCGATSTPSTKAVVVNDLPVPTITPNSPVCQNVSNNFTTQAGQTSYIWSVTPDGTITPTANPNVVSINWTAAGAKTVGVIYTSSATGCTAAAPGTTPVTVTAAPTPTIAGVTSLCVNSGYYDYVTQTGKTGYTWTVSSGGTITAGQGTASAQVVWNTPGAQWVAVNYNGTGGCSALVPTVYNVTVSGMPGSAGSISGPSTVCLSSVGISYSVPAITNAMSYIWTLPAGATIASGFNTNSITVDFSGAAVSGNITVYGNSLCGNGTVSPSFPVTVTTLPVAAGAVTGTASVCAGEMGVAFSVTPVTNATGYVWNLPTGATIATGGNTPDITVDFSPIAVSGDVSVYGTNQCGNGTVSPNYAVTVHPVPHAPVIVNHGDTLFSNAAAGNQWYYEGAPINNAVGQSLVAHYSGWYWDAVTLNGCTSDTSNNIYITITGINDLSASGFVVSPVPNDGQFKLTMNTKTAESFDIVISNTVGAMIYSKDKVMVNGPTELLIDLRPVPAGVYTMIIRSGETRIIKKIVVNK
ncbi:MAG: T9SS type A sorting domain-containing protein [Bacteroidota bacterium]